MGGPRARTCRATVGSSGWSPVRVRCVRVCVRARARCESARVRVGGVACERVRVHRCLRECVRVGAHVRARVRVRVCFRPCVCRSVQVYPCGCVYARFRARTLHACLRACCVACACAACALRAPAAHRFTPAIGASCSRALGSARGVHSATAAAAAATRGPPTGTQLACQRVRACACGGPARWPWASSRLT
jgi:hypothetical protein